MSNGAEASDTSASNTPKLGKTPPSLTYFCVYNPSLAQSEENTKDQILYYTAKKVVPADVKMKQIGLAQALVNFSSAFSPTRPAENVHSQKNRLVFYQPEPGFWMHMCIELGVVRKQTKDSKGKDKLVTEYLDSQLSDLVPDAILRIGYEQFKLLNGTMTSMLQAENLPQRQRIRSLMHSIEEFFEEWIWKWNFDLLDANIFSTVFNGFPMKPLQRSSQQLLRQLEERLREKLHIQHYLILNPESDLVYHSRDLSAADVCALRRWICDRGLTQRQQQPDGSSVCPTPTRSSERPRIPSLKSLTKSLSNTQIFNYFSTFKTAPQPSNETVQEPTNATQTETTLPAPSEIPTAPSSPEPVLKADKFVIGLADDNVVRVYLYNDHSDQLEEHFLLLYQHISGLVWTFLLPLAAIEESNDGNEYLINVEKCLTETEGLESAIPSILTDSSATQDKSLNLGKHYRFFCYDNRSRVIRSTLTDRPSKENKATGFIVTNDMFIQLLELRNDLESNQPKTVEVYTRSTSNYWVAGRRTFHRSNAKQIDAACQDTDNHQEPPTEDEEDRGLRRGNSSDEEDYVEVFLVAAKKETSLAEVEDAVRKLATSVADTT